MSKETKATKKKVNWAKTQLYGFWGLVVIVATFWLGTYTGTQMTLNSQAHEAHVKTEAIESYKASLKVE